ncbi:ArsR family transcriptional regulator [Bryobacterales bacterium F-183]|nr:ArsR family transcriptional regulator [Bryobacterales bacterium F-183]
MAQSKEIDVLVEEIIARVADRWTMVVLEALEERGTMRFTELSHEIPEISQKMLTKTVRQMERDGLVKRKVYAVIPPKVEYTLTDLGRGLSEAFCGVWIWAEKNHARIHEARKKFDAKGER